MQRVSRVMFLVGLAFLLVACPRARPDEPIQELPATAGEAEADDAAEETEEQTLMPAEVPTVRADDAPPSPIYGLLPATSHVAIALVPRALDEEFGETFMIGDQGFAAMQAGAAPMIQDLLGPEGVELVDRGQRQLMAITTASYEELLSGLRAGAPLMSFKDLPRGFHVRSIVPTDAADELAEALMARCAARSESGACEEFLETEATPDALVIDWLLGEDNLREGRAGRSLAATRERWTTTAAPPRTAAWLHFEQTTKPLAVHARAGVLADFLVLPFLGEMEMAMAHATPENFGRLRVTGGSFATQFLALDSPEISENYDLSFAAGREEGSFVVDGISTLTPYGREVSEAGNEAQRFSHRSTLRTFMEVRAAFDLVAATEATRLPYWAEGPTKMDSSELRRGFSRLTANLLLGLMQYPISTLRMAAEFGDSIGRVPSEVMSLRGFWLGATLRPERRSGQMRLLGALHMVAGPEVDLDALAGSLRESRAYRDLNLRNLTEWGYVQQDSRTLRDDDVNERRAVLDDTVDGAFDERVELVAPGLTFSFDLQKFLRASGNVAEIAAFEQLAAFNLNALIQENRYLRASVLTGEGQWRVRGSLGSGELATPALMLGGEEPPAVTPRSVCALQISQASTDKISEAGRDPERLPEVAGDLIAEVRELAQSCADDEDAQERAAVLVEAWQSL